jgi:hypothetical protein
MADLLQRQNADQAGNIELALLFTVAAQEVNRQIGGFPDRGAIRADKKQRPLKYGINADYLE